MHPKLGEQEHPDFGDNRGAGVRRGILVWLDRVSGRALPEAGMAL